MIRERNRKRSVHAAHVTVFKMGKKFWSRNLKGSDHLGKPRIDGNVIPKELVCKDMIRIHLAEDMDPSGELL